MNYAINKEMIKEVSEDTSFTLLFLFFFEEYFYTKYKSYKQKYYRYKRKDWEGPFWIMGDPFNETNKIPILWPSYSSQKIKEKSCNNF